MVTCPKCLSNMEPMDLEGTSLALCPGCQSLWLTHKQAKLLFGPPYKLIQQAQAQQVGQHYLETSTYLCPQCTAEFESVQTSPTTHLSIARCRECAGIFLEAGKFNRLRGWLRSQALNAQSSQETATPPPIALQARPKTNTGNISGGGSSAGVYLFQLLTSMPVRVEQTAHSFGIISLLLVLVNLVVYALVASLAGQSEEFYQLYGFVPIRMGEAQGILGLFTSMFLHGGLVHLLSNMYFLWLFGEGVEQGFGPVLYPILYLTGGITAWLFHGLMTSMPDLPAIGASGAISGLTGAYLVLFPSIRMYQVLFFLQFKVTIIFYAMLWLALQIFFSQIGVSGVAWYAHIGGFAFGAGSTWCALHWGLIKRPAQDRTT